MQGRTKMAKNAKGFNEYGRRRLMEFNNFSDLNSLQAKKLSEIHQIKAAVGPLR
jgi:hypothetical protein